MPIPWGPRRRRVGAALLWTPGVSRFLQIIASEPQPPPLYATANSKVSDWTGFQIGRSPPATLRLEDGRQHGRAGIVIAAPAACGGAPIDGDGRLTGTAIEQLQAERVERRQHCLRQRRPFAFRPERVAQLLEHCQFLTGHPEAHTAASPRRWRIRCNSHVVLPPYAKADASPGFSEKVLAVSRQASCRLQSVDFPRPVALRRDELEPLQVLTGAPAVAPWRRGDRVGAGVAI